MFRIFVPIAAVALCSVGCNHDNVRAEQQRERAELQKEQAAERHAANQERLELQREQHQERAALHQNHGEEQIEVRQDAREDLVDGANELAATTDNNLTDEVRELNALISEACMGISESERATCPLNSESVQAVGNMIDGVRIKLTPVAGTKDVLEHRIACYRARAEVRHSTNRISRNEQPTAQAANDCLLDQPGLEMALKESDGQVELELTTDSSARVRELRSQARSLNQTATNNTRADAGTGGNSGGVASR